MKILHVTPLYAPSVGGGERHIQALSERLAARGHDVTVFTTNIASEADYQAGVPGRLPEREVIRSVHVRRFRVDHDRLAAWLKKSLAVKGSYRVLSRLFHPACWAKLFQEPMTLDMVPAIIRSRVDLVGAQNWSFPQPFHAYLARRWKRFPFVGFPLFHTTENWARLPVHDVMLPWCDAVAVNTDYEAEFVRRKTDRPVVTTGVGIDPEAFQERDGGTVRRRYGLGEDPVVGFVGRQVTNKGIKVLVQAMRYVWKWNARVRLVLAGHRPPELNEIDHLIDHIAGAGDGRILRLYGFPEHEKASLYDAFDVYAMPSIAESFGIAYLEAWLCKKPVIGADIGQVQCVIDHGLNGLLVDPSDPENLAAALIGLLSDTERRHKMGEQGYVKTLTRYTWERVTDRVETLYRTVASGGTAAPWEGMARG